MNTCEKLGKSEMYNIRFSPNQKARSDCGESKFTKPRPGDAMGKKNPNSTQQKFPIHKKLGQIETKILQIYKKFLSIDSLPSALIL